MTDPVIALVMLGILVFTIMIGFPVAFTLMALGVGFGYYAYFQAGQAFFDNRVFYLLTQNTFTVLNNDVLVAVPLFLFMGYMVERAGVLDNLFYSIQLALRRIPGSLAIATLITCAMFATATGIVGAVVTLMGLLAFPQMLKAGYDVRLASGVVCAGGCLGIMIPPSILLIVYGAMAGLSVVQLYAAALFPGFVLATMYIVFVGVLALVKPQLAPPLPDHLVPQGVGDQVGEPGDVHHVPVAHERPHRLRRGHPLVRPMPVERSLGAVHAARRARGFPCRADHGCLISLTQP